MRGSVRVRASVPVRVPGSAQATVQGPATVSVPGKVQAAKEQEPARVMARVPVPEREAWGPGRETVPAPAR